MIRFLMLAVALGAAFACGCGGRRTPLAEPSAPKKPKKAEKAERKHLDIKPVEVAADEFPSVEAALAELDEVLKLPDGDERNRAEIRVQDWLVMQHDQAVPPLIARAADRQQSLEMRLTTCRILGKLGPGGVDTLIALTDEQESSQLRRKAIQTLGNIKPEKKTIDRLILLLDDADLQVQQEAIAAITAIGPPAKTAAEKRNKLRQERPQEGIRVAAGEALKKVDPRTKLVDQRGDSP